MYPHGPCKVGLITPFATRAAEIQGDSKSPEAAPRFLSGSVRNRNLKVTSLPLEREASTCTLGK